MGYLGANWILILEQILNKLVFRVWTGFSWLLWIR